MCCKFWVSIYVEFFLQHLSELDEPLPWLVVNETLCEIHWSL